MIPKWIYYVAFFGGLAGLTGLAAYIIAVFWFARNY